MKFNLSTFYALPLLVKNTKPFFLEVAFTLARVADKSGSLDGQRLSLFVVKLRNEDGQLNNIKIHKLKDKSGTKPLPTAELELQGTRGLLIGLPASGVRNISYLFNITRIWVGNNFVIFHYLNW